MTKQKILFTPVGTTDPTFKEYDGSVVQAIKQLKPDKVYLYLSYDMKLRETQTNTVGDYLDLLKCSGINFEHHFLETTEQENENPQLFDKYYREFNKIIAQIVQQNSATEIELYLNISSGTPAMKSTLFLLSSSLNIGQFKNLKKIAAIQVDGPSKNREVTMPTQSAQELYSNNHDKNDDTGKRAYISKTPNISSYLTRRQIIKFIDTFDYNGALQLAKSIEDSLNPEILALLTYGQKRRNLSLSSFTKTKQASLLQKDLIHPSFTTSKTTRKAPKISRDLYEYLLNLRALAHNNDYLNFIRGLSPALSVLFADALRLTYPYLANEDFYKKDNGFGCFRIPDNISFIEKEKLREFRAQTKQNMGVTSKVLSLTNAVYPYLFYTADSFFKKDTTKDKRKILILLKFLRLIEESSRNIVAHEIVALSPAKISEKAEQTLSKYQTETEEPLTGNSLMYKNLKLPSHQELSPTYIFQAIEQLCRLIYTDLPANSFAAYETLNAQIKEKLDI